MTDESLLERSARIIDGNVQISPKLRNPIDLQLSEIRDGLAMLAGFSHILALDTDDGLTLFDTSSARGAATMRENLRQWRGSPVNSVIYTHGHVDHVSGTQVFIDEARDAGWRRPRIIGHENIARRFRRYEDTNAYNMLINGRQFSPSRAVQSDEHINLKIKGRRRFGPQEWFAPDTTFTDRIGLNIGGVDVQLFHARGETDDHAFAWIEKYRAICAGDFLIWTFPNAGNPQKVQRYPLEWAAALRQMAALRPELILPAHGLPIAGEGRIARVLDDVATVLESLVQQALKMMNDGARLDQLIHEIRVPGDLLDRPYLQPLYDEPEFVVHNIWRQYGGWYDGNPATLKPAPEASLAGELAELAGGARRLAARAAELAERNEMRLAGHLIETASLAEPADRHVQALRAQIYEKRRDSELSLMARGIFGSAAADSRRAIAEGDDTKPDRAADSRQ